MPWFELAIVLLKVQRRRFRGFIYRIWQSWNTIGLTMFSCHLKIRTVFVALVWVFYLQTLQKMWVNHDQMIDRVFSCVFFSALVKNAMSGSCWLSGLSHTQVTHEATFLKGKAQVQYAWAFPLQIQIPTTLWKSKFCILDLIKVKLCKYVGSVIFLD